MRGISVVVLCASAIFLSGCGKIGEGYSSFDAISNKRLSPAARACEIVGRKKVTSQANSYGVTVDMDTFRLDGSSANLLAKYFWWSADVTDVKGRTDVFPQGKKAVLTILTQKPAFRDCF